MNKISSTPKQRIEHINFKVIKAQDETAGGYKLLKATPLGITLLKTKKKKVIHSKKLCSYIVFYSIYYIQPIFYSVF
jgi:hypothetical protein